MTYPPGQDPYGQQQPYGQQPYHDPYQVSGAPASPANPYGQQYQQPYQGYPPQNMGTNTMAILALVFAFVFAPLAIVFGHMAKKQIKETGEQGEGLATAGLVMGYIFTGIWVLTCGFYVFVIAILGSASTSSTY